MRRHCVQRHRLQRHGKRGRRNGTSRASHRAQQLPGAAQSTWQGIEMELEQAVYAPELGVPIALTLHALSLLSQLMLPGSAFALPGVSSNYKPPSQRRGHTRLFSDRRRGDAGKGYSAYLGRMLAAQRTAALTYTVRRSSYAVAHALARPDRCGGVQCLPLVLAAARVPPVVPRREGCVAESPRIARGAAARRAAAADVGGACSVRAMAHAATSPCSAHARSRCWNGLCLRRAHARRRRRVSACTRCVGRARGAPLCLFVRCRAHQTLLARTRAVVGRGRLAGHARIYDLCTDRRAHGRLLVPDVLPCARVRGAGARPPGALWRGPARVRRKGTSFI